MLFVVSGGQQRNLKWGNELTAFLIKSQILIDCWTDFKKYLSLRWVLGYTNKPEWPKCLSSWSLHSSKGTQITNKWVEDKAYVIVVRAVVKQREGSGAWEYGKKGEWVCSFMWVARESLPGDVVFRKDLQVGRMFQWEEMIRVNTLRLEAVLTFGGNLCSFALWTKWWGRESERWGQARGVLAEELCQGLTSHLPQRWEIASYIGWGLRQAVRGRNRCRETTWETVIQGTSQSRWEVGQILAVFSSWSY